MGRTGQRPAAAPNADCGRPAGRALPGLAGLPEPFITSELGETSSSLVCVCVCVCAGIAFGYRLHGGFSPPLAQLCFLVPAWIRFLFLFLKRDLGCDTLPASRSRSTSGTQFYYRYVPERKIVYSSWNYCVTDELLIIIHCILFAHLW